MLHLYYFNSELALLLIAQRKRLSYSDLQTRKYR